MQDRHRQFDEIFLQRTAGPYIRVKSTVANMPAKANLRTLAATIKARWICEQAHQQLKEELGLDHFEGRSWQGLHRHALMTMIAYAFLQHRRLAQAGRKKKESTGHRLSRAYRPYAKPSSISSFNHDLSDARTAEDQSAKKQRHK
jgi:SRSO17 transposase